MRFRLNIQLWLVFLWSEGSQCIVTLLHPRAQNCLRNCETKYTWEGKSYVVERAKRFTSFQSDHLRRQGNTQTFCPFSHHTAAGEHRRWQENVNTTVKIHLQDTYWHQIWQWEKRRPGSTEICMISLAHWYSMQHTVLNKFNRPPPHVRFMPQLP